MAFRGTGSAPGRGEHGRKAAAFGKDEEDEEAHDDDDDDDDADGGGDGDAYRDDERFLGV